ncbi:MAG: hypothetical protein HUK08_01945, partial [Bacteroidaceae bacterium]|nr:hypothetical protein [Bacteroidaceae bacterium]
MAIARIIADNILSPLGRTTEENYKAVKAGRSGLRRFSNICDTGFSGMASLFTEKEAEAFMIEGYTKFESLAISSIRQALSKCKEQIGDYNRTILIISTTKGNVGDGNILGIANAAEKIGEAVGLVANKPIVVSNACISGVSALILAQRLLAEGAYDYAVVCGAEVQCKFIAAGFQSLKALSSQGCRPFDMDRVG